MLSADFNHPPLMGSRHKTQLVLLEPNLTDSSTLPVLASATQGDGENMAPLPTNIRQKRIKIADGLRWILGNEAMGTISAYGAFVYFLLSSRCVYVKIDR